MSEIALQKTLSGVLEGSRVATLITDAQLRVRWSNAATQNLLGKVPMETRLNDFFDRQRDAFLEPDGFVEDLLTSYTTGTCLNDTVCRFRTPDGDHWLYYSSQLLDDSEAGRVERFVDISDHRRSDEQRHLAEKMEALGKLAGSVAHDFNNLLTAINGYSQLLERMLDGESQQGYVQEIRKAGKRATKMTSELLRISSKQIVHPVTVDLRRTIQDRERLLQEAVGENVRVFLRLAPQLGSVEIDPNELEQALLNIAINAREAMPEGGEWVVAGRNVDLKQAQGNVPPGRYVALQVTDNGVGMLPEVRARAFEPLFTTKEITKGTGYGLATTYASITRAGGFVDLESAPGQGTTLRILFPRISEPETEDDKALTVLLVEDNEAVRNLLQEIFRHEGYSILAAEGARQALELIEGLERVDLVISDVIMPEMNGPELAQKLVLRFPRARFLFISGYDEESIRQHGMDPSTHTVVQKPFDPLELIEKVRELLKT